MSRPRGRSRSAGSAALLAAVAAVLLLPAATRAQFSATVAPDPVALVAGGGSRSVTVSTDAPNWLDPIQYEFAGLPAGISTGVPQVAALPYPPLTFPFAAAADVPRGTYAGTLVATSMNTTVNVPVTVVVTKPDFTLEVVPSSASVPPGTDLAITVRAIPIDGFGGTVSVSAPLLAGIGFTPFAFDLQAGGSRTVTVSIPAGAAPGPRTGFFIGKGAGVTRTADLALTVTTTPDFTLRALPASLALAAGEAGSVTVTVTGTGGFGGPVTVNGSGPTGVTLEPAEFVLVAGGSRAIDVTVDPGAPAGPATVIFTGTAAEVAGPRRATVTVQIAGAPPPPAAADFALTATPAALDLAPGESGTLTLAATGVVGATGPIDVRASPPPGLALQPAAFSLAPGGVQVVEVTSDPAASAGLRTVAFTATAPNVAGERAASAIVTILAPVLGPAIHAIDPPAVVAGTVDRTLRLTGERFVVGASVASASPGVLVTAARILGPQTAEVIISVREDAAPGPYRLELTNPDGALAVGEASLLVYPPGALGAPLAVTDAVIVAPRPRQILEAGAPFHARALLATSGIGTIVGTWLLDGVPFDRFTQVVTSGHPIAIRSNVPIPQSFTGEHRVELAIESPAGAPVREQPFFQATESRTRLRVLTPRAGGALEGDPPAFRWTLVPGASGYEVEVRDPAAVEEAAADTLRRRVTDTEWRPEEAWLRSLGPGMREFRVRAVFPGEVRGEPTEWVPFRPPVEPDGTEEGALEGAAPFRLVARSAASPPAPPPRQAGSGELALAILNTTSTIASELEDPPPLNRLQVSTQTDFRNGSFDQQATADLSGSHDLEDPWHAREESRNWLTRVGLSQARFREELSLGFAPPGFFDRSELLTVFHAGGGLEAGLETPLGRIAYYRSVDLSASEALGTPEPEIDAAAYEVGDGAGRFLARALLLEIREPEAEFDAGGAGRAVGVIASADFGPRLRLLGELARGEFEPGAGSFDEARDGRALRLALAGSTGTLGYDAVLGWTGEGFVNPANRGFTPAGISDRALAEVSLRKALGRAALSGTYRHVRGGIPRLAGDPETSENGASARLDLQASDALAIQLSGQAVVQRGDAADDVGIPATDRGQKGLDLGVTERVGSFTLGQTVGWQAFSDDVEPRNDQDVRAASATAHGALTDWLGLASHLSHTWTETAAFGATRQLLFSLQPGLTLPGTVTIAPRSAWTRTRRDGAPTHRSEHHQVVFRWSPPWVGAALALEIASDWSRSWSDVEADPPSFDRQTVLTLTLDWTADRSWGVGRAPSAARPVASLARAR